MNKSKPVAAMATRQNSLILYHNPAKCCFLNTILATDYTDGTDAGSCICAHPWNLWPCVRGVVAPSRCDFVR